jgi:hypothetical protein
MGQFTDQTKFIKQNEEFHAIDWNDPSQQAMANEDLADDETIDVADLKSVPREALKILLRFLIPAAGLPRRKWRVAQLRLATLAYLADVDDIGGQTLTEIAEELQCTRALLSLYHVRMLKSLKIPESRGGKSKASRAVYSKAATAAHARAGHKMSPRHLQQMPSATPPPPHFALFNRGL